MPLDEELDALEMKILVANKAANIAQRLFLTGENAMGRAELIATTQRMADIAAALPPEIKQ